MQQARFQFFISDLRRIPKSIAADVTFPLARILNYFGHPGFLLLLSCGRWGWRRDGGGDQCDQIWRFLKVLGEKLSF